MNLEHLEHQQFGIVEALTSENNSLPHAAQLFLGIDLRAPSAEADYNQNILLIKHWPSGGKVDPVLETLWHIELRQLQRLQGISGTHGLIPQIRRFASDEHGFYLALDTGQRIPLPAALSRKNHTSVNGIGWPLIRLPQKRIAFWYNILRISKALQILHQRGWVHRNLTADAILANESDVLADDSFQLGGFEWTLILPEIRGQADSLIKQVTSDSDPISFQSDWLDLCKVICLFLQINPDSLNSPNGIQFTAEHYPDLVPSEINLLQCMNRRPINSGFSIPFRMDHSVLIRFIEVIDRELKLKVSSENQTKPLVLTYDPKAVSRNGTKSVNESILKYLSEESEDHTPIVATEELIMGFIQKDLSAGPHAIIAKRNWDKRIPYDYFLKGSIFVYKIISHIPLEVRRARPGETITDFNIGFILEAHVAAEYNNRGLWSRYDVGIHEPITQNQIQMIQFHQRDYYYLNRLNELADWKPIWDKLLELEQEENPYDDDQQTLLDAFILLHIVNIAYLRTEIYPVTLIQNEFLEAEGQESDEFAEQGRYFYTLEIKPSEFENQLANNLVLNSLEKRLGQYFDPDSNINDSLFDEDTFNNPDVAAWALQEEAAIDHESGRTQGHALPIALQFEEIQHEGDNPILKFSSTDQFSSDKTHVYLRAPSVQGTMSQLRRQASALSNLMTHIELIDLINGPEYRTRDSGEEITNFPEGMDVSKIEALKQIVAKLPLNLVQGPPGVGKSYLINVLTKHVLRGHPDSKIIYTAQSHSTISQLYEDLKKSDFKNDDLMKAGIHVSDPLMVPCFTTSQGDQFEIRTSEMIDRFQSSAMHNAITNTRLKRKIAKSKKDTDELDDDRNLFKDQLLRGANLLFSTSNSRQLAAMRRDQTFFDWSIVEEAGKANGLDLLNALMMSHRRLLIGDHLQLPPFKLVDFINILGNTKTLRSIILGMKDEIPRFSSDVCTQFYDRYLPKADSTNQVGGSQVIEDEELTDVVLSKLGHRAIELMELFKSLIKPNQTKIQGQSYYSKLIEQRRMHPDIGDLVSKVFYGDGIENEELQRIEYEDKDTNPPPFVFTNTQQKDALVSPDLPALIWIDTPYVVDAPDYREALPKWQNQSEQQCVIRLLQRIQRHSHAKYPEKAKIAVLTPYNKQRLQLEKQIQIGRQQSHFHEDLVQLHKDHKLVVSTIDSFQGDEAELVIISLVRNNHLSGAGRTALGILADERRMNVMFSRAKYQMVVIGSLKFLQTWAEAESAKPSKEKNASDFEFIYRLLAELERMKSAGQMLVVTPEQVGMKVQNINHRQLKDKSGQKISTKHRQPATNSDRKNEKSQLHGKGGAKMQPAKAVSNKPILATRSAIEKLFEKYGNKTGQNGNENK